uniref:DUF3085 domain-containing protein n=1 Tax=Agrobacterium tumefaciens TaxID=358 RepID=A0A2Z2PYU7_AGRTU|nr:DUF3085 domain-containing protein [Agrobacterium radiobacter]ASK47818.1 hypothetical protein [Agrobacterium radiobacter]
MFTFSVTDIRVVMMHGRLDAYLNGGFRNPHYGVFPGRDEKPGLWLVGDEGVYILSFGGDDGVEFLDGAMLVKLIAASPGCTHLKIAFLQDSMQLFVIERN